MSEKKWIPYGRQWVDREDMEAVHRVLGSDWLTTGPMVEAFEAAVAAAAGTRHAVAVSSGTAALHAAVHALGLGPGDEAIVPAMTFAATANAVLYQGARPVFADVDPDTLLLDPADVERKITPRTRAVIPVDYAGQPCDYDALQALADEHGLKLLADACHSLGASYRGRPAGALAALSAFSFHPVKTITTGEGGAVATDDPDLAGRMRTFRNHGIATDHRARSEAGSWFYEMVELGYNYRITDFQCALGRQQLTRLAAWVARRQEIAALYDAAFRDHPLVAPLAVRPDVSHAYHLYVVRIPFGGAAPDRAALFQRLRERGIGANVHYIPVHLHPYYRERLGTAPGLCPTAEAAYEEILSLPMYPKLGDGDVRYVIETLTSALPS